MNTEALWQALQQRGLVTGEVPASSDHPWPIRLMVGAGAWAGSLLVLAFIAALTFELLEHSATRLILAAVALLAGRWLARRRELLTEQLGLIAAALAQTLALWSVLSDLNNQVAAALALIVIGLVSMWVPLALFRVWCSLVCLTALVMLLDGLDVPGALAMVSVAAAAAAAYWWFWPQFSGKRYDLARSVAFAGLMFALGATAALSKAAGHYWLGQDPTYSGAIWASLGLGAVNLWVARSLALPLKANPLPAMGLMLMLCLATWTTPSVSAALLLILLGYGRGERWLLGLGLMALPLSLSAHYYVISWSLNLKALSLAASGVLLLSARLWLRRHRRHALTDPNLPGDGETA